MKKINDCVYTLIILNLMGECEVEGYVWCGVYDDIRNYIGSRINNREVNVRFSVSDKIYEKNTHRS